jgi:CRISPR-associated protein Cas2
MGLTIVITNNVEDRYRGFLSSILLEIAPGVYTGPKITTGARDRIWGVLSEWHNALGRGSIIMTWDDPTSVGGQRILSLGQPIKTLVEIDGQYLSFRRAYTE